MDHKGIYITVSSSSQSQNEIQTIKQTLQETIDTKENLEIGLIRCTYPKTWFAVEGEVGFRIWITIHVYSIHNQYQIMPVQLPCDIRLQPALFLDLESDYINPLNETVHRELNRLLSHYIKSQDKDVRIVDHLIPGEAYWKIEFDRQQQRVVISDPGVNRRVEGVHTRMSKLQGQQLWRVLGFQFESIEQPSVFLPITATRPPTVASTTTLLNIYAYNLIRDQRVGDTFKPLLEIVPVTNADPDSIERYRELVTYQQEHPIYKRLLSGYISQIVLDVRDDNDEIIPIITGHISIILHIRPCRSSRWKTNSEENS